MTTTTGGSRWKDLPDDLLAAIGHRLDSRIDVFRFRSVCNSWRSSVPFPNSDEQVPPVTVRLPYPVSIDGVLDQSTICNFQFLSPIQTSSPGSSSSSDVPLPQGWLIKAEESPRGKLVLTNPISNHKLSYSPIQLNLLDVRLLQLRNSFRLRLPSGLPSFEVNRVVMFPPSASPRGNNIAQLTLLGIYYEGKLGYWRTGDERWTLLDDKNFEYDDIIPYRGQFYVVDRWGTVSWIDSSLNLIQYSPPLYGCGGQKNLVESNGDLYVVDRYLDGARRSWKDVEDAVNNSSNPVSFLVGRRRRRKLNPRAIDFRVYKLDEEWGTWVNVTSLGDRVFVLTTECSLSVSAAEFVRGKGNCIYYSDDDDYLARGMLTAESVRVFQFEDRSIEKLGLLPADFDIFHPPPSPAKLSNEAGFIWRTCLD
ncbi:Putative F-box protein At1g65770 [Linum perenne]